MWLYGGLALAGALTMYRTQVMLHQAKTIEHYDPISNAMGFYLDSVNIFIRVLMIMNSRKK